MSRHRDTLHDLAELLEQLQTHAPSAEEVLRDDAVRQAATIRWLRLICESAGRLPHDFGAAHREIARRARAISAAVGGDYDTIELDAVWRVLRDEMPPLADSVAASLQAPESLSDSRRRLSRAGAQWDEEPRRRLTLDDVRAHRSEILAIGARHGARSISIFGSVARGEADEASDVDVLVELEAGRSLLDLSSLRLDLVDLLGVHVDVATVSGLRDRVRDDVMAEAVAL
jgi:uncharacterized protein